MIRLPSNICVMVFAGVLCSDPPACHIDLPAKTLIIEPAQSRFDVELLDLRGELEALHTDSFGWSLACCERNHTEAEDVLQSAYEKVLSGKARFDGRSSFKTFLFGVIRLTAAEQRRWNLRLLRFLTSEIHIHSVASASVEVDGLAEMNGALAGALGMLPARQREVLHLVFYHDMTIENAAGIMRVTIGTARTHYERGKARLRTLLAAKRI